MFQTSLPQNLNHASEAAMKQDPYNHMGWRERAASHLDGLHFTLFFPFLLTLLIHFPSSVFFLLVVISLLSSLFSHWFFLQFVSLLLCIILPKFLPFIICSGLSRPFEFIFQSQPKPWVKLQPRKLARAPGLAAKHRAL